MEGIKIIALDLDGTLLDTLADLTDATNYTLRYYGFPEKTEAEMRVIIGSGARYQLATAMGERAKDLDMDQVLGYYRPYYDAHSLDKTGPYPGVVKAIDKIKGKHPVGIVSNKPHPVVKELCANFFPGIYALGEDPALPRKPAPDMVKKAMADLGVDRCIYVGDTQIDVETAKNAGVPCLCVLWGFRDRDVLEEAGARYLCDDSEMLPQLIEKIIGEMYGK